MNPVFMFRPKIKNFKLVDYSKTSFPIVLSGDEKVFFKKNEHSFVFPAKKFLVSTNISVESTLRWIDSAMNESCDESTLRWIDPVINPSNELNLRWFESAMNRPSMSWTCDESTLWWIDLAINRPTVNQTTMNRLCDESTRDESTRDKSYQDKSARDESTHDESIRDESTPRPKHNKKKWRY
jgi:hypothetical protein